MEAYNPTYPKNWDWRNLIPSQVYYRLAGLGWPGWDLAKNNEPFFLELSFEFGSEKSSRNLAIELDDLITGRFWYRDWTNSGMPWGDPGEVYRSIFIFERESDYKEALEQEWELV